MIYSTLNTGASNLGTVFLKNTVHGAPFVGFKSATDFDHLTIPFPKFLNVNVLYWHRWFHEEHIISMKPLLSTKGSILGKVL